MNILKKIKEHGNGKNNYNFVKENKAYEMPKRLPVNTFSVVTEIHTSSYEAYEMNN